MKQKQTSDKRDKRDPKKLDEVLDHYRFRRLIKHSQSIHKLNELLPQWLPADIAAHCRVMNIDQDRLALEVDNAAMATRLRFMQKDILSALRFHDNYRWIKRVSIHVRESHYHHSQSSPQVRNHSRGTNKLLQETAKSVKNPALRDVLNKISKK